MLARLSIRNLAIIEQLEVEFAGGFEVLSGETGAGKSAIVQSLALLLETRVGAGAIRSGADSGEVEAEFRLAPADPLRQRLQELELDAGQELLLRRVLNRSGRSRALVNGRTVPAALLVELARELVAVSGQHEHVRLIDEDTHLLLLDEFAGLGAERTRLAAAVARLRQAEGELQRHRQLAEQSEQRREFLEYSLRRIREVDPRPGEMEQLGQLRERLRHREKIAAGLSSALGLLQEAEPCVQDLLGQAEAALRPLAGLEPALASVHRGLGQLAEEAADLARELTDQLEGIESPVRSLEEVENRLDQLRSLARAHGGELPSVLEAAANLEAELAELQRAEQDQGLLERKVQELTGDARRQAEELSARRRRAAGRLAGLLEQNLRALAMSHARVDIAVDSSQQLQPTGCDQVRLLLSANPDHPPQPLARVASGGELSRVLLAIKTVLSTSDPVSCYVFDEVDAGIGGQVAAEVGRQLQAVGSHHQVICITHLAPIAACASTHYRVSKGTRRGRTVVRIARLDHEQRIRELARMLSGRRTSNRALEHARELLRQSC